MVRNNSDQAHQITVTFFRFKQELWVERGETPTFENPEIPTAEPEVEREFNFDVGAGKTMVEKTAITEPLCGAVTMVEVEMASGGRYTTYFVSMCYNSAPEGTSNVQLDITISDSNELAVDVLTRRPGAA